jgi:hypothetical protein
MAIPSLTRKYNTVDLDIKGTIKKRIRGEIQTSNFARNHPELYVREQTTLEEIEEFVYG